MPWKLSKWKDCDGGCCVRAPRFPRDLDNPGMSDCVYHENGPGGEGRDLRGGCRLIRELNSSIVAHPNVDRDDLLGRSNFSAVKDKLEPPHGLWQKNPLQWFFDTCWGWPVRSPAIKGILQKVKVLGLWDEDTYDPGMEYDRVYSDQEMENFSQTFHVTSDMTQAEKEAQEPACCHLWEEV